MEFKSLGAGRILEYGGRRYINFASNDYLGLAKDKRLIKQSVIYAKEYGVGSGASSLITGYSSFTEKLEKKIAKWQQKESALIFQSGFQANCSIIAALLDMRILREEPIVFVDKKIHASIHFGLRAAKVRPHYYDNCNMEHLNLLLDQYKNDLRPKFIITESLFSMDGNTIDVDRIKELKKQYDCFLICDEAHSAGLFGENGSGIACDVADCVIGTFSKALGVFGAYVACDESLRQYLINCSVGFIYSTSLPPQVLGPINEAIDLIHELQKDRDLLHRNAKELREAIKSYGFDIGLSNSHIIPVIVGKEEAAQELEAKLKSFGIWCSALRTPTVPKGASRIRISLSRFHTQEDIEALLAALKAF